MPEQNKTIVKVDRQHTRAKFDLNTFDEATRTVEVTFATETPVRSYDWELGPFREVLSCDPTHIRMERMSTGTAPVLDNHNQWGSTRKAVVGVVESAWTVDSVCRAKIRFSKSEDDQELMEKVRDGIVCNVSVGYNVYAYELTRATVENELPTYKAIDWEPTEISFVPVPADANARVRSEGENQIDATVTDVTPADAGTENTETENQTEEEINNVNSEEMPEEVTAPTPEQLEQTRTAAATAERERIGSIRSLVRMSGLEDSFAQTLIDEGVDLPTAQTRALKEWEKKNPLNPAAPKGAKDVDAADKRRSAMANALVLRIDPAAAQAMGAENVRAAGEYKGMNFLRFAEEALIGAGVRTRGMSAREIAVSALGGKIRGLHHTTDFPLLLMDTVNRTLLAQYAQQPRTFMTWARRATIGDFRPVSRVRLSEIFGDLLAVKEGEEYKYATLSESGETYKLGKFGRIIGITWEAIVNDDLSAFTRIPQSFAAKAAIKQTKIVYGILLENGFAPMGDGKALFHADHGNFVGTAGNQTAGGTELKEENLDLAYQAFMAQKDAAGDLINVTPKFLVVGPKNATRAMKLTSADYTPNSQMGQPLAQSLGLQVVVDSNITGLQWFLIADPSQIDTVEYAFLDGEEELFIEQREGFNIDGVEVKARMVFAAKAIDWRGIYRNNGAALT